jgi:hypothetical protein
MFPKRAERDYWQGVMASRWERRFMTERVVASEGRICEI